MNDLELQRTIESLDPNSPIRDALIELQEYRTMREDLSELLAGLPHPPGG